MILLTDLLDVFVKVHLRYMISGGAAAWFLQYFSENYQHLESCHTGYLQRLDTVAILISSMRDAAAELFVKFSSKGTHVRRTADLVNFTSLPLWHISAPKSVTVQLHCLCSLF